MLTQAQVHRLFDYDPSTGLLRWKVRPSNRVKVAQITVQGKKLHLGFFDNPADASAAYNTAAVKHFGSFARI